MRKIVADATPKLSRQDVDEIGDRVWKKVLGAMAERKEELALRSLYGDGWNCPPLDQGDFNILSAVRLFQGQGTGDHILAAVQKWAGPIRLIGASLEKMEEDGLVTSTGQGGPMKRQFRTTDLGERALLRAKKEGKRLLNAVGVEVDELQPLSLSDFVPESGRIAEAEE